MVRQTPYGSVEDVHAAGDLAAWWIFPAGASFARLQNGEGRPKPPLA
jgi:hypothetical protein